MFKGIATTLMALPVILVFAACGDSSGGGALTGNLTSVTLLGNTSVGTFTPSITPGVGDDGVLRLTVAGLDVDNDGTIDTPIITKVTASSGDSAFPTAMMTEKAIPTRDVRCNGGQKIGEGVSASFDIGMCLDTTSSMGAAAGVLADEISEFATSLVQGGVDASFTACTLGDAFATKASSSIFTDPVSRGSLGTPPIFDTDERPDTGTSLLPSEQINTFFAEVARVGGRGGGDAPENYLGCIEYLNDATLWRSGAGRILISIGDSCSHTTTSAASIPITEPWTPPEGADLERSFLGVVAVHVIGPENPDCSGGTYNMETLSSATGGTFTPIGNCSTPETCQVDLNKTLIGSSITGGVIYGCDGSSSLYGGDGTFTITVNSNVTGSSGSTFTAVVTMLVEMTFG